MSFVNEIDDVVYILTVLSFFIFIGCYYLFRTLSLSFYYTHYCKILLYYISFLPINYLSICLRLRVLRARVERFFQICTLNLWKGEIGKNIGKTKHTAGHLFGPFFLHSLQQDKSSFLERELRHYCCILSINTTDTQHFRESCECCMLRCKNNN